MEVILNFQKKEHNFSLLVNKLEATNPIKILKMGYSQTMLNDKVINSIKDVAVEDEIKVKVSDGVLDCKVIDKSEE